MPSAMTSSPAAARPTGHIMFICYVVFAIVAGAANLGAQELFLRAIGWPLASVVFGTGIGFAAKYVLDKHWVFFDSYESHASEARKVLTYGAFGVGTTLLFWGIELACWHIGGTAEAKYTGAIIGLTLGNWIKYLLDKRFVFPRTQSSSSGGFPAEGKSLSQ
jgi:putative flippase GtrA